MRSFSGLRPLLHSTQNPNAATREYWIYRQKRAITVLSANRTIVCGVTIGKYAFIGAGSVINCSVPDYALMVGVPAKQIGWMSEYGERLDLPLTSDGKATCPRTGRVYILKAQQVTVED
ncbi:MAG: hypothetical protein ACFCUG_03735 [Thiotrichales bacterium]